MISLASALPAGDTDSPPVFPAGKLSTTAENRLRGLGDLEALLLPGELPQGGERLREEVPAALPGQSDLLSARGGGAIQLTWLQREGCSLATLRAGIRSSLRRAFD